MPHYNRRDFLKHAITTSLYLGGGVSVLNADEGDNHSRFDDYKALVYLYLDGGNDGLNTFIPIGDDTLTGYLNYAKIRNNIRVSDTELSLNIVNGAVDLSGGNPYNVNNDFSQSYTKGVYRPKGWDLAINGMMPELAHLANDGKVAVVANVGNIIKPAKKSEFQGERKRLPPFLFSHAHQSKLAQNGMAGIWDATGWAGRVADVLGGVNSDSHYTMNISVTGYATHLFDADNTPYLIFSSGEPIQYHGLKRQVHDDFMKIAKPTKFRDLYNRMRQHSFLIQDVFKKDWEHSPNFKDIKNAYGGDIFTAPAHYALQESKSYCHPLGLMRQFRAVAKYAKIAKDKGIKRQIFFVFDGGYDTHRNQAMQHAQKLREISMGIGDFYKALESLQMQNDIVTMSASDFGRSTGNNGDGTDHAWGSNLFMVGGEMKGGVYGTLPNLTLGSDDDLTHKGRLIPTTSMSQYYATALKWFGLTDTELDIIFPELSNFSSRTLDFL